jgi:transglutaminase-like putative cysteine protease
MRAICLLTFLHLLILSPAIIKSQSLEQVQQVFPDKLAVFSNINRAVEIGYKKDVLYAENNEVSEMMIFNDNANGLYNKHKVFHSSFNELKKVEAYTAVPEGNSARKIKVTDFKTQSSRSDGVFYDDHKETSFDYPRIMKGSICHVETAHYNKDIRFLSPFYFSSHLPTYNANFTITYPADVDVRYIIKNDNNKIVSVTETVKGNKRKLEFTAKNIKNYEHYSNGVSVSYYALHVIVYVASYRHNNEKISVFGSVDQLYKWNAGFLNNINSVVDDNLRRITDSICVNKKTDREKAQAIFLWVQHHVKYVAFEEGLEGFIPRQAADVYAKRYGDCKDMASILTAMLRISGLNAYFTWIGTRTIPYSYTEVPLPFTDNHMISAVDIDKSWVFLDATDPNCIFGMPTSAIQGKEALIGISPEKYALVKVPVMPEVNSSITDSTFLTISNNTLLGKCSVVYSGYFGTELYNSLLYNKGSDEREYARRRMTKGSNKFIMKDYRIGLSDPVNRVANISSGFEIPDYVKSISDEIYINLNLEKLIANTSIDINKRNIPIQNDFLYTIRQVHTLEIPDGYTLNYMPKNVNVSNDVFDFSISYKDAGGRISATQQLLMKKLYIQPHDFTSWNNALSVISPAYKEQIVLKKK